MKENLIAAFIVVVMIILAIISPEPINRKPTPDSVKWTLFPHRI